MKRILGLDLGTNSIGWAIVNAEINEKDQQQLTNIEAAGSRIIPMDAATLGDFDKGKSISQTAERTKFRGFRHLRERSLLRRERLHRVLSILGFLPTHYADALNRYGQIKENEEPKLAWKKNESGKYEFLFADSFNEMLKEFHALHPETADKKNNKIPYDWTLYYLRKKALTQKITKEELAWILLNFNQKRGYYQFSEEDNEDNSIIENLLIIDVIKDSEKKDKKGIKYSYNINLEKGYKLHTESYNDLSSWIQTRKDFIITPQTNKKGTTTYKISILPSIEEIEQKPDKKTQDKLYKKIKVRTEILINETGKTVGAYIYDTILQNPSQKVRGKLVRTIERKFYKEELILILKKQQELHNELQDSTLYKECIESLYLSNEAHRNNIANRDFVYLFIDDILFYQRPLKTKKHLISNCPYETHVGLDKNKTNQQTYGVKCIAKSHPLYQEFRLWQFISNLRIYKKELSNDIDVTKDFIKSEDDIVALFELLNKKKSISQEAILKHFDLNNDIKNYRWNYVEDKEYPCNETHSAIISHLKKARIKEDSLKDKDEEKLWNILYSINDKQELTKALRKFADKNNFNDSFVEKFAKFPPFKKEYGSYSAKAIKKLLPLMRTGKYWKEEDIDTNTRNRIENILSGEYDENIRNRVREKAINLNHISEFKGLPLWLACYVVYNRHSEAKEITKWDTPEDLDEYLRSFKQHSLRNPIVEQVITETLRTVRDIWNKYGNIDEIHVELGREMKNPADKRAKITKQVLENESTNLRIKTLLMEFKNPEFEIEDVRPYSPSQQEILRIYEEGVLNRTDVFPKDNNADYKYKDEIEKNEIEEIINKFKEKDVSKRPTKSEIIKYKLWLEQKYRSPYTGKPISLAKLFTSAYEIEHIIPQSRYFDDSLSNKVICEAEVNKLKDNLLGYEFIKKHSGEKIELSQGKVVTILTENEYEEFVKDHYSLNRTKMRKLFMEEIPDDFIARQLNDSRYISKVVKGLLSNIVREDGEEDAISKNIIVCTGGVTDRLKKDWGMNDVWNKIILPRFEHLNEEINKDSKKKKSLNELINRKPEDTISFTDKTENGHIIPCMPLELQKGFNKKRIDHRHHAMDAIIIACADRNIVNYLNNESASNKATFSRHDLQRLLCNKVKTDENGNYQWILNKPWDNFTQDAYKTLDNIVISFKQNLRVINKATNKYTKIENGERVTLEQKNTDIISQKNWAIRKPMHKDTVFGEVNLRRTKDVKLKEAIKNPSRIVEKDFKHKVKSLLAQGLDAKGITKEIEKEKDIWQDINLDKIKVYYFTKETKDRFFATRKSLDTSFNAKKIEASVTDTGIQKILLKHLKDYNNNPELAFSPDGIDAMNKNIIALNEGKFHQPIYKVRVYEKGDKKFAVGKTRNKSSKFVEAKEGTNLYFAVYETETIDKNTGDIIIKRNFVTVSLNVAVDRLKQGLSPAPESDGQAPIFVLSPNDLVYVPETGDTAKRIDYSNLSYDRIYKFVSCTSNEGHFVPAYIANPIIDTIELGSNNKAQRAWTDEMIKEVCIPIKVDRLGNITKIGY